MLTRGKIFGWTFDGLRVTVQRYHCEDLYTSGRVEEAAEVLLKILDTFGEEISASKVTVEWVTGEYLHLNLVDLLNICFENSRKNVSTSSKNAVTQRSVLRDTTMRLHGIPPHCCLILQIQ